MKQDFILNGVININKLIKKTAMISIKKALNKLHVELAQQGLIQVKLFFLYYYLNICKLILVNG